MINGGIQTVEQFNEKIVPTICGECYHECGILAHVKNGKVSKIEGNPRHPINLGAICIKAINIPEALYSTSRILHPLKKEDGRWKRISWDEAFGFHSGQAQRGDRKIRSAGCLWNGDR